MSNKYIIDNKPYNIAFMPMVCVVFVHMMFWKETRGRKFMLMAISLDSFNDTIDFKRHVKKFGRHFLTREKYSSGESRLPA